MAHKSLALMVGASLLLGTVSVDAQDKRYPESAYRHNVLEQVKYSIGNIRMLVQGLEAGDGAMKMNARNLHTASLMMKGAFAKDTRGMEGKTDAKDEIWENWADFESRVDKFVGDTGALMGAVEGGDKAAIGGALRTVFSNCKGCHDKYKAD